MADIVIGVILAGLSVWVYLQARTFPHLAGYPGPGFFPTVLALGLLGASMCLITTGVVNCLREACFRKRKMSGLIGFGNFLTVVLLVILYVFLAPRVGFFLSAASLLFVLALKLRTRVWVAFVIAVVAAALLKLLFQGVFKVPLPYGPLPGGW